MTTSLITGMAGFIGSHVARHCLSLGHTVIGLDDLSGGYMENLPPGVIFEKVSIVNGKAVDHFVHHYKPDYIYHLAAYAAENRSHYIRHHNYMVNMVGSANVINAAIKGKVKRLIFTSSAAVYGWKANEDERSIPTPVDPYGIAKYAIELDLKVACDRFGLNYTIFRPHNVYGPGQSLSDGHRNVVGIFMRQCLEGKPMTIYGDGRQGRAFSYIDDVAPFIARCVELKAAKGQTISIGDDGLYNINMISKFVAEAMGVSHQVEYLPERDEVFRVMPRHIVFQQLFGTPDRVHIEDGLARMAEWAKQTGVREARPAPPLELALTTGVG